jgi:hypothetical protein
MSEIDITGPHMGTILCSAIIHPSNRERKRELKREKNEIKK